MSAKVELLGGWSTPDKMLCPLALFIAPKPIRIDRHVGTATRFVLAQMFEYSNANLQNVLEGCWASTRFAGRDQWSSAIVADRRLQTHRKPKTKADPNEILLRGEET